MQDNFESLSNKELFELSRSEELKLSARLQDFLLSQTYPWQCLGKSLTDFVVNAVESVPQSQRMKGKVSPKAHLENVEQIVVEEGAEIEAFAFVSGPCFIEKGGAVRHGAYVRGSVYIAQGAVVGHTSEAKGTLLLPDAKASHFAYVGDSILGVECNLGAGTKLANLRFDHSLVEIKFANQSMNTGLKKFGAILGNRAQTGCNSVTNPGTILFANAMLLPTHLGKGVVTRRA